MIVISFDNTVRSGYGPMARDVDSLAIAMKAYLHNDVFVYDTSIPPLPWQQQVIIELAYFL